jgi:hypothetical protein
MGEWRYSSTILHLGTRWKWVVCFTPLPVYQCINSPSHPLYRRLGGSQSQSGHYGGDKNLPAIMGIEPWLLSSPACSLVIILSELLWLLNKTKCSVNNEQSKYKSRCLWTLWQPWDVMPCCLAEGYKYFGGKLLLPSSGWRNKPYGKRRVLPF